MANRTQEAFWTPEELGKWQAKMEWGDARVANALGITKGHFLRLKSGKTNISQKTANALIGVEARHRGFTSIIE